MYLLGVELRQIYRVHKLHRKTPKENRVGIGISGLDETKVYQFPVSTSNFCMNRK